MLFNKARFINFTQLYEKVAHCVFYDAVFVSYYFFRGN